MKLPGRRNKPEPEATDAASPTPTPDADAAGRAIDRPDPARSRGKGRPTPRRRDQERARGQRSGPVAPAPMTRKEARARRKAERGSMTKAERKAAAAARRAATADARERMMEGDEKFLLARDKGPVRAYARDVVDSRRHLLGLFMPLALVLVLTMFLQGVNPNLYFYANLVFMGVIVVMITEAIILGRQVTRAVRERFPDSPEKGLALGWYAFVRASQPRRMRAPRPRVNAGDAV